MYVCMYVRTYVCTYIHKYMWQSQVENEHVAVALKFTVHVRSSIIHKGTQKIWSDFNKAF